jgi:hypothetical protein
MPYENYRQFRRPDRHVLFAVRLADGSSAYTRIAPNLATFGVSPGVMRLVAERQASGEIPAGDVVEIVRVR